jgi:hypothetical protein
MRIAAMTASPMHPLNLRVISSAEALRHLAATHESRKPTSCMAPPNAFKRTKASIPLLVAERKPIFQLDGGRKSKQGAYLACKLSILVRIPTDGTLRPDLEASR